MAGENNQKSISSQVMELKDLIFRQKVSELPDRTGI